MSSRIITHPPEGQDGLQKRFLCTAAGLPSVIPVPWPCREVLRHSVFWQSHGWSPPITFLSELIHTICDPTAPAGRSDWRLRCICRRLSGYRGFERDSKAVDGWFATESEYLPIDFFHAFPAVPVCIFFQAGICDSSMTGSRFLLLSLGWTAIRFPFYCVTGHADADHLADHIIRDTAGASALHCIFVMQQRQINSFFVVSDFLLSDSHTYVCQIHWSSCRDRNSISPWQVVNTNEIYNTIPKNVKQISKK